MSNAATPTPVHAYTFQVYMPVAVEVTAVIDADGDLHGTPHVTAVPTIDSEGAPWADSGKAVAYVQAVEDDEHVIRDAPAWLTRDTGWFWGHGQLADGCIPEVIDTIATVGLGEVHDAGWRALNERTQGSNVVVSGVWAAVSETHTFEPSLSGAKWAAGASLSAVDRRLAQLRADRAKINDEVRELVQERQLLARMVAAAKASTVRDVSPATDEG